MPKRKKPNLWLKKPKQVRKAYFLTTPKKTSSFRTPTKSPGIHKRQQTPESANKSRKKIHFSTPTAKSETIINEHIIFDEFVEPISEESKEYIDIATGKEVIEKLSKYGLLFYFTLFFKLVSKDRYPLTNIALLLWLETVRWFSLGTCQEMWYWEVTKMFWRAGHRLFHGKFLSFMSGPRSVGTVLNGTSSTRTITPEFTEINFAVPCRTSILDKSSSLIPSVLQPGVIHQALDAIKTSGVSKINMMCVDGKKVTAGLDEQFGDVNVFGFEDPPSIADKRQRLNDELQLVDDMKLTLSEKFCNINFSSVDKGETFNLVDMMRGLIFLLTLRLKEGRHLKKKQEFGLEKLKERAGSEWKTSKYVYAISGIQAFLYRVRQFIQVTLSNIGKLCEIGSEINEKQSDFRVSGEVDPTVQQNMFLLKEVDEQVHPLPTNLIKQRSEMWKDVRKLATVTGSTLHNAIGLRTLKEQKLHFDVRSS